MKFRHSIEPGYVSITFEAKPDEKIRAMLKANGFRWSPAGHWWRSKVAGAADFIGALEKRLNPGKPDGACWECKNPQGFFRPYGAATPVYCDACHAKHKAPQADPMGVDRAYEDQCRDQCGL